MYTTRTANDHLESAFHVSRDHDHLKTTFAHYHNNFTHIAILTPPYQNHDHLETSTSHWLFSQAGDGREGRVSSRKHTQTLTQGIRHHRFYPIASYLDTLIRPHHWGSNCCLINSRVFFPSWWSWWCHILVRMCHSLVLNCADLQCARYCQRIDSKASPF